MSTEVVATVPGEPCAQGRPRGFYKPGLGVRMYDPAKSRNWKGVAQVHYQEALKAAGVAAPAFPEGALGVYVVAVFACPKSHHRKTPVPRRPKATKPDAENVLKAVQDAGNGLLWTDDSQIADARIEKVVAAQGEAPYVQVTVRRLEGA